MREKAFTLVELAIVLVIIGLLVGGVLAGQELVEQARLNKVIAEYTDIKRSITTFRAKYGALPGDYNKAANLWGVVAGSCDTDAGTGTQTCNGNGDNDLGYDISSYEPWRAWEHLSNSQILGTEYSGIKGTSCTVGNNCYVPGSNAPAGNIDNTIWAFFNAPAASSSLWSGKNRKRHVIALGMIVPDGYSANYPGRWHHGALKVAEQFAIDTKLDNGMPHTGTIVDMTFANYSPGCATSDVYTVPTATYAISNPDRRCILIIDYD